MRTTRRKGTALSATETLRASKEPWKQLKIITKWSQWSLHQRTKQTWGASSTTFTSKTFRTHGPRLTSSGTSSNSVKLRPRYCKNLLLASSLSSASVATQMTENMDRSVPKKQSSKWTRKSLMVKCCMCSQRKRNRSVSDKSSMKLWSTKTLARGVIFSSKISQTKWLKTSSKIALKHLEKSSLLSCSDPRLKAAPMHLSASSLLTSLLKWKTLQLRSVVGPSTSITMSWDKSGKW